MTDYSDSTPDISYTYNPPGQQKNITDAPGSRSFHYVLDSARLDHKTLPDGSTLTRNYDTQLRSAGLEWDNV